MPAELRSAHPDIPGVPWWGAALIALTATALGFAFDAGSGSKELSVVFSGTYMLGCLVAVLAVRQAGLFTAVVQPPIVLFAAVPSAYFLFHGGQIRGLKDLAINCGYPLIERFPVMFFTSAAVLVIGMVRWYLGMSARRAGPADPERAPSAVTDLVSAVTNTLTALVTGHRPARADGGADLAAAADTAKARPRKRAATDRAAAGRSGRTPRDGRRTAAKRGSARAEAAARAGDGSRPPRRRPAAESADQPRSATRSRRGTKAAPPRSRPTRALDGDYVNPLADAPRRRRPTRPDDSAVPPDQPRRRSRGQARGDRTQPPPRSRRVPPREPRRQPSADRIGYDGVDSRPESRSPRPRRSRVDGYEPLEPHTRSGARGTHHPVSRVRYRSAENPEERAEYRNRPRHARHARGWEADSWEYDI